MICILAQRGRFLETILQDGARSGVPRLRREPYRGRFGPRPPGVDGLARAVAARPVFHCRGGQRGSAAGKRHGGAPRGVPVAPGRSAPYKRGRRASQARQKSKSALVGAPSTPHSGVTVRTRHERNDQPARKLAARERERRGQRRDSCGRGSRNAVVRSLVASGCLTSLIWREAWLASRVVIRGRSFLCRSHC